MGVFGYDWEPYEVVTDDGYILVLMHVTKKRGILHGGPDEDLSPVLVSTPLGATPHSWLWANFEDVEDVKTPMLLKLRDAGHDLWFTYSRGHSYSNKHEKYAYDSKEFWDYSWEEMGVGDIRAALSFVNAHT